MLLNIKALQQIFTEAQIEASTYTTRKGSYIRLINNKPDLASIPALYPNLPKYKHPLVKYDNVYSNRIDYKDGEPTGNKKTDLYLNYKPAPIDPELPLPNTSISTNSKDN